MRQLKGRAIRESYNEKWGKLLIEPRREQGRWILDGESLLLDDQDRGAIAEASSRAFTVQGVDLSKSGMHENDNYSREELIVSARSRDIREKLPHREEDRKKIKFHGELHQDIREKGHWG